MSTNEIAVLDLCRFQKELDKEIETMVQNSGLSNDDCQPVYDGVADEKRYVDSPMKVLWLLQEPYDNGDGTGGGWSLPKDVFLKPKPHDPDNPTQQTVAYAMWCYVNHKKFCDAPVPSVVYQQLASIAWVNISKMPAKSSTQLCHLMPLYHKYWQGVIKKQINGLSPDVIVVAGQHFKYLSQDGTLDDTLKYSRCWPMVGESLVDLFLGNGPAVLYTDHPAYWRQPTHRRWRPTLTQEGYVDAISEALYYLVSEKIACRR